MTTSLAMTNTNNMRLFSLLNFSEKKRQSFILTWSCMNKIHLYVIYSHILNSLMFNSDTYVNS